MKKPFAIFRSKPGRPRLARQPAGADGWLPLAEAARALFSAQRDTDLDRISRGLSTDDESLLAFWAARVAQIGVPIYGCRIASTKREPIPEKDLRSGRIIDQASRLQLSRREPTQDFCDLQVSREDFDACLHKIRGGAGTD